MRVACYDPDADIAWFPTGESDDVVSERVPGGLHDYDRATRRLVAIEVWEARTRLPITLLESLPVPALSCTAMARPTRTRLPQPLQLPGGPRALSRALEQVRGER